MTYIEKLTEAINKENFHHINFVNEFYDLIPGFSRDAKMHKVKRDVEKIKNNVPVYKKKKQKEEKPKGEKFIQEVSPIEAPEYNINTKTNKIIFGLISDTHFNSKYTQISHLNQFYNICAEQGITDIYHCGDIDDGENMRPGHAYENYKQGADEHIAEIVKNYPYVPGITTHFITGNHDASFRKSCGLDIGNLLVAKRPDFNYLGRDIVNINITDKIVMQLRHPWNGTAYALSYRPQKIVESMEAACIDKPDIVCIGHFHKLEYLFYHGVHVFQTGCFQGATPFTTGKGISVAMGGWIIEIEINEDSSLKSISPKLIPFNRAIKEDYKNYQ